MSNFRALTTVAALAVLAACSGETTSSEGTASLADAGSSAANSDDDRRRGEESAMPASAVPPGLDGITWRLVAISDDMPVPGNIVADIAFTGTEFAGQAPCNRYFGAENPDASAPAVFGPVGATMMMCSEETTRFETAFLKAIGSVKSIGVDGNRLVMSWSYEDVAGDLVFEKTAQDEDQN